MKINVTFMSGAGNLFSVIDNREIRMIHDDLSKLARFLCNYSQNGIMETEGLLVLNESQEFDFEALFFNPDGSHGMMCGNGGRCAVNYAMHANLINVGDENSEVHFCMLGDVYRAKIKSDIVELFLPPPKIVTLENILIIFGNSIEFSYVNVNTDHAVINFENLHLPELKILEDLDINEYGKAIRYHDHFLPSGANTNFYRVNPDGTISLRTYERGVEKETGACGTGAVSTAIVSWLKGEVNLPVTIYPPSQSPLIVNFNVTKGNIISDLSLTGNAVILSRSEIDY